MSTNVRITLWDGGGWTTNVDFDAQEIAYSNMGTANGFETLITHNSFTKLVDQTKVSAAGGGREAWVLNLEIKHIWYSTRAKALQVLNNPYKVRVFWKYHEYPSTYKDMIIDPNWSENYVYGGLKAMVITQLQCFGIVSG